MGNPQESLAAIEEILPKNWIDGGCAYSPICNNHHQWKDIIASSNRFLIRAVDSEKRSALLVAALLYSNGRAKELCRTILTANEVDKIDTFEYYSKVLWLIYSQAATDPKIKAKIALALELAPEQHLKLLYSQEYDALENMKEKGLKNMGYREAEEFMELCHELLKKGASNWLAKKTRGNILNNCQTVKVFEEFEGRKDCEQPLEIAA